MHMRSVLVARSVRCVVGAVCIASATLSIPAQSQTLDAEAERLAGNSRLAACRVGISIYDISERKVLAHVRADEAFTPASNMKLLTSGAAVIMLGPGFSFRTELLKDVDRLIVKGDGDPALADTAILDKSKPKLTVDDVLSMLVQSATKAGMNHVSELVIDDRVFDREWVHPAWAAKNLDRGYSAPVSGLNFHMNVLSVYTQPNAQGPGTAPIVKLEPAASWIPLSIKAQTVRERKNTAWISRAADRNAFTIHGDVGLPSQSPSEHTVFAPPEFFGRILAERLEQGGVRFASPDRNVRLADPSDDFSRAKVIGVVTTSMVDVLRRCNADSENLYAESIFKRMGQAVTHEPGSWTNGAAVLRMVLSERINPEAAATTIISDGSGLSRQNAVSPKVLTGFLSVMSGVNGADFFISSLAEPGKPGTLQKRFQNVRLKGELRGKSGFINGVRCLSGYVTSRESGRRVAFSVMVNDIQTDEQTRAALELHESVVKLADDWLERSEPGPGVKRGG